ncbi:MAG: anti-anti-sigma factor [Candidatus Marinimicrobia bacterium]|nr:anti-anti-sigma factor [Candidatus Neomarinimicrobiota bacterium]|tara:strand:+ start:2733 stop:3074 length:342 start_codon:yes stop_codon:yes gene_type:complete
MDFSLTTRNEGDVVIIETNGYLNNVGGEQIAQACYKEIDNGKKLFLINLENSKVVNSIGVSILIEIIEKLQDIDGKLGYYNLAPIVEKTFNIMGLTKYSSVFSSESEALQGMS